MVIFTADLTKPHEWYLMARLDKRKVGAISFLVRTTSLICLYQLSHLSFYGLC